MAVVAAGPIFTRGRGVAVINSINLHFSADLLADRVHIFPFALFIYSNAKNKNNTHDHYYAVKPL